MAQMLLCACEYYLFQICVNIKHPFTSSLYVRLQCFKVQTNDLTFNENTIKLTFQW